MGKLIQRSLGEIKEVVQEIEQIPSEIKSETIKTVEIIKEIPTTVIQYIDREVIKEIPVEVIKYVDRFEVQIKEIPVETIKYIEKEVEKFIEVPVHVVQEVEKQVVSVIHKIPYWCWMLIGSETLILILTLIKK